MALAEALCPGLGAEIARNAALFDPDAPAAIPAAWIAPALDRLATTAPDQPWPYLLGTLRGFLRAGGPGRAGAKGPMASDRIAERRRLQDEALDAVEAQWNDARGREARP